ncbi:MAG TPA: VWA domain-containing protein [Candidatus Acidoferrales bacterium]|nr:VWA domain-containing protein [Candidatus Acidoferrales bacterium]
MMRATIATFLCGLMIASAQPPQTQQPNTPAAAVPKGVAKFEATSQLVVVDVFAKDKSGAPLKGLKAGDFTITEDGKKQDIKVFAYQELEETVMPEPKLQPRPAAPEPAVAKAPDTPAVKSVTANQIAPSKAGEVKYKDRRLLVMFFDMTSMPIQDQIRAQTAAQKFLKTQMTQSDLMAIMSFSTDMKLLQDFTDDRDALAKVVKGLTIGEGSDLAVDGATGADNEEDTGAAYTADDTEFNIFNTDRKLAALESAAKMLGALSEKKALVYFASGVSKTGIDNEAQLRATINAAIRNNVAFYPIDARGLVASAPLGDATKGSPGGAGMYSGSSSRTQQSSFQGQQETLYTLAADTGGKALLDNNDLALGIQQAQKDISSYYMIGYYSTNMNLDGRYRRIKLTVNNTAVAKLDYRPGYFAGKNFKQFTSSDKERQLQEALMLGDPVTDISIVAEVDYFRLARDRYFVPVTIKIPGSELELAKHGGADTTKIDFIGEVKDAKGVTQGNVRDYQEIKLKGETASQLAKRTLAYDTGFTLAPGTYTLKFLTRENTTGKMGTLQRTFTVPDLTTQVKYLPISSVVLSNQRQDMKDSLATAEKDKKLLASNPLVQDNQKLVPSVTNVFRKDQDMYVFLEAYQPDSDTTRPIVASVSFYRGKVKAFETAPLQITEGLNAKSKALPVRFSVPMAKLQPGKYTCQVSVLDPAGQKFAFWRAPIALLP